MKTLANAIGIVLCLSASVTACPFCDAVTQTFAERIETMDIAVFAQLVAYGDPNQIDPETGDVLHSKFRITRIIKGEQHVEVGQVAKVLLLLDEEPPPDGYYFLTAGVEPELFWDLQPVAVTERTFEYVDAVLELPAGPERLSFFIEYLEDSAEDLRKDAYSEFAKTPYEGVIAMKEALDREMLREWIRSPDVTQPHRKLYFTLLGVCGNSEDVEFLEQLLRSDVEEDKAGMDALIASYLSLKGEAGLTFIEETYLANEDAKYEDVFSAITAIRFHGNESDVIPREALNQALRQVLARPSLADLVIADLARWEDWSVVDQVKQLFLESAPGAAFLRVPALNYLKACPLPSASAAVAELRELRPDEFEQAEAYGMFADFAGPDRSENVDSPSDDRSGNKSQMPGLAERVQAMVEADERAENPYPGLLWGIPLALAVIVGAVMLGGRAG